MEKVDGIGGVFFRAKDPDALREWYTRHLGMVPEPFAGVVFRASEGDVTAWSLMASDSDYIGPLDRQLMVNYRVRDLDAMLIQLRQAGVQVDDKVDESEFGKFGWATDPEGNRFELWQPPQGPNATS